MSTSSTNPRNPVGALLAFTSGAVFAVGLAVAGMTQPAKVVG
ncbi:MAG: YeeE/YedE family protein, partial [Polyangiaceae bacterium]|nr:YeeE/YedE family protein [Polyangiaceae bacterium]